MTLGARDAGIACVACLILLMLVLACPVGAEVSTLSLSRMTPEREFVSDATPDPYFLYRRGSSQYFNLEREGVVQVRQGMKSFADVVKKEPEAYKCERPFRCVAQLGQDSYGFVFDSTDLYVEGYHQIYFDSNRNGDLTDDGVIQAIPLREEERQVERRSSKRPWGPEQLIGPPDVTVAGDSEQAWSPRTRDGGEEWLLIHYEKPVKAKGIKVYETYAPGAVARVAIVDRTGTEEDLWNDKDPTATTEKMGVSEISFEAKDLVEQIKVYIDSKGVPGWNEIDTVGLVDDTGEVHWPVSAEASSHYQRGFMPSEEMSQNRYVSRDFLPQTVRIRCGSEEMDYTFFLSTSIYYMGGGIGDMNFCNASLRSATFREGEITVEGTKHKVVLLDYNTNGRFDDQFTVFERPESGPGQSYPLYPKYGDMVMLDPNPADREYPSGIHSRSEWQYLSRLLRIKGRYYDISVAPSGATMSLVASQLPLGSINNPNPFSAVLYGDKGLIKVSGVTSEAVAVPAGNWRMLSYRIDRTQASDLASPEQQGPYQSRRRTYVEANGVTTSPTTHVEVGANVLMPFGPPYRPVVKMREGFTIDMAGGKAQMLSLSLIGSASEVCSSMRIRGSNPPQPSLTIATAKGEIIQRGSFEYG